MIQLPIPAPSTPREEVIQILAEGLWDSYWSMHSKIPSMSCPIGSSFSSWQTDSTLTPCFRSCSLTTRAWVALRVNRDVWWTTMVPMSLPGFSTSSSICRKALRLKSVPEHPGSMYSREITWPLRRAYSRAASRCAGNDRPSTA